MENSGVITVKLYQLVGGYYKKTRSHRGFCFRNCIELDQGIVVNCASKRPEGIKMRPRESINKMNISVMQLYFFCYLFLVP